MSQFTGSKRQKSREKNRGLRYWRYIYQVNWNIRERFVIFFLKVRVFLSRNPLKSLKKREKCTFQRCSDIYEKLSKNKLREGREGASVISRELFNSLKVFLRSYSSLPLAVKEAPAK